MLLKTYFVFYLHFNALLLFPFMAMLEIKVCMCGCVYAPDLDVVLPKLWPKS